MTFGQGGLNFYVDSPEAVAQAVMTRLRLLVGEWFLDITEGTDYLTQVLGYGTEATRDIEIRARILGTQGVTDIQDYTSSVNPSTRLFSVKVTINTIYGQLTAYLGSEIIPPPGMAGVLDYSIVGNVLIVVI